MTEHSTQQKLSTPTPSPANTSKSFLRLVSECQTHSCPNLSARLPSSFQLQIYCPDVVSWKRHGPLIWNRMGSHDCQFHHWLCCRFTKTCTRAWCRASWRRTSNSWAWLRWRHAVQIVAGCTTCSTGCFFCLKIGVPHFLDGWSHHFPIRRLP